MSDEINKLLLVAFDESSREPAYGIVDVVKQAGYSVDIARIVPEEGEEIEVDTKIHPDVRFAKDMDLSNYKGAVFLDSGGDEGVAKVVAKRAAEEGLVVGGYANGCKYLLAAKLLKDKKLPVGLPEEFYKGSEKVNAPAVRNDKLVVSAGGCPAGFALLVVSAMGGKVKKEVEGSVETGEIPRSGLIVASFDRWTEFWPLAESLAKAEAIVVMTEWDDIDIPNRRMSRFLAIGPLVKGGVALHKGSFNMPKSLWLKHPVKNQKEALAVMAAAGIEEREPANAVEWSDEDSMRLIERELSHQGVWLQDGGVLAMKEGGNILLRGFEETMRVLRADSKYFAEKFSQAHDAGNQLAASGWATALCRTMLIGKLVRELRHLNQMRTAAQEGMVKTADYIFDRSESNEYDYSKGTVPGPYSNVRMPTRVIPWQEGDDWLDDINWMGEQAIANLSRYKPESKNGFYAEFDLWHENDPTSWEDTEKGDSIYKMREQLQ